MNEVEFYGVFFDDSMQTTYICGVFDDEQEAEEFAQVRGEAAFDEAVEKHADEPEEFEEPEREDFEGMYYVEPVDPELAEKGRYLAERNLAIRVG